MEIAKTKTIGGIKIAGQKFCQAHWVEILNPEHSDFELGTTIAEIEKAEVDEKIIRKAYKDGNEPVFRGLPVRLAPTKADIEKRLKIVEIPDDNPPPAEIEKPVNPQLETLPEAEEKKKSGAVKKKGK
jgi:hypothetical protein